MSGIPKSARWNPSNVMGSGCAINMVTGMRGVGKTYAMKKIAIKQYIKRGATWAYVRYFDTMIDRIIRNPKHFLFDIIVNDEFTDYDFKCDGTNMFISEKGSKKWEQFGKMYSLTSFDSYKGSTTPDMELMVLDEFIKEKRNPPYPPNTVETFFNLWDTFDRREDRVKVVMLANAADLVNPFFREWRISPIPKGTSKKFKVGNAQVYYENAWNADYQQYASASNIGKYSAGSSYDEYSLGNEFAQAKGIFLGPKPKHARCQIALGWGRDNFGVWYDRYLGGLYINDKPSKNSPRAVLMRQDMMPDLYMIDRTSTILNRCVNTFKSGAMTFSTDYVRETFLDMLTLCGLH